MPSRSSGGLRGRSAITQRLVRPQGSLIERVEGDTEVPPTWCVVVCEQGCQQSWSIDTRDFDPPLTASDVEQLLSPVLLEHEQEHQGVWR